MHSVTSAFNNLGVTFFAPSDFVGFRCVEPLGIQNLTRSMGVLQFNATTNPLDPVSYHQGNASFALASISNLTRQLENPSAIYPPSPSPLVMSEPLQHPHLNPLIENHLAATMSEPYNHSTGNSNLIHRQKGFLDIFNEFLNNDERKYRHSLKLNYDTPKKGSLQKECKVLSAQDQQYHKCKSFQYDTGIWISTIIDEWDLICDRAWFISVTQSLYMSGFIVSYLIFGYISDRLGRWRSLFLGALIEVSSGFGCAFASSVTAFMISRFLLGIGNAGRTSSSYLIMIEWTGPKWRMHISTLGSLGWAVGYCVMPWITIYFLHFRHMQLFVCFYEIIFVIWLLRIPESPRWLLTHRKFDEAYTVLLNAAKFNGLIKRQESRKSRSDSKSFYSSAFSQSDSVKLNGMVLNDANAPVQIVQTGGEDVESSSASTDDDIRGELKPYTIEEYNIRFQHLTNTICAKEFTKNENKLSALDLMKWKNLRRYLMTLAFAWASNSFIYYGIALRVGDFGGKNLFFTFTIAGLTELPSIAFTILFMKFMPRRTTHLVIFTLVGLLCAIQLPLKYYDYQWLQQTSIMLAKLFNSCSFTVILYQTMELFPTSIRQTAYSCCSLAGRIGSILAPFIKELSQMTSTSVPPIIYAMLSFGSAIMIVQLPETKGSDLPDTLLEAEKFKGTDKIPSDSNLSKSNGATYIQNPFNYNNNHNTDNSNGHNHHLVYDQNDDNNSTLIRRKSMSANEGILIDES